MSETQLKTKRHHVTREEEADRDLNGTTFSKGAATTVAAMFLAFVFGVPVVQHLVEIQANQEKRAHWTSQSGQPKPGLAPKVYSVFDLLPTSKEIADAKGFWGYWSLIPSTEEINKFEEDLKQQSVLTQALLSPAQSVLTGILGVGNEKAYCGKPGWLFYRPDVEYLTSDGFLDPHVLRARSHAAEIQPDPVKAILDFKKQLDAKGITLVVMPMPTKPMIHPEMLVGEGADQKPLQNPSYGRFMQVMEANGVRVYDPTALLLRRKSEMGAKQYLETDTHWTPEAMAAVSKDLSRFVNQCCTLPAISGGYQSKEIEVSNLGDIAEMLKLPANQTIYKKQTVRTEQIVQPDGSLWMPDRHADVMLLGDSFSNIFSLQGMNWGEASGFAEHLSRDLGRPVDKIVINAGGAFASREELARQMYRDDRLAGKRVVVYEFSMRDLAQGDWKMIALPTPPKRPDPVPPVQPKPTPPVPTGPELKVLGVEPSAFDPTRGESVTVRIFTPKGTWTSTIVDAKGKAVHTLGAGEAELDGEARAIWDGKLANGENAAPGSYKVTVTGTRADGTAVAPVTASVLITGGAPSGKLEAIGATPDQIDAVAAQTTSIDFSVPASGVYTAEVIGTRGTAVRRLGTQRGGPGVIHFQWNGKDAAGKPAADGTYTVRLSAEASAKLSPVETKVVVKSKAPTTQGTVPPKTGTNTGTTKPPLQQELVVTGRIAERAVTPAPGSGPYKDCVIALHLTDLKVVGGTVSNANIVVYVWGMRDNKLVDGAYAAGQTITFRLTPWDKVEGKYGGYKRQELDNPDSYTWPAFWGEAK